MSRWTRLALFRNASGVHYGDLVLPPGVTDASKATHARILTGDPFNSHTYKIHDQVGEINRWYQPLKTGHCRTIRCLGINYAQHAKETNLPIPKYPVLFYKPITAASGPNNHIRVPKIAQETPGLDYECELVVVIGKRTKNVAESEALEHVAGYSVGNDVSHREWQIQRGGSQWSMGKCFDTWAPWGPAIVSTELIKDPQNLDISTKVNGRVVQQSNTRDMIFGVAQIVSFLSQGTTLMPGDIIFTGTPEGVGLGRKPPLFLEDGDVVEVSLEGVGSCINKIVFDKDDKNAKL